jgi:hypothetical protein
MANTILSLGQLISASKGQYTQASLEPAPARAARGGAVISVAENASNLAAQRFPAWTLPLQEVTVSPCAPFGYAFSLEWQPELPWR